MKKKEQMLVSRGLDSDLSDKERDQLISLLGATPDAESARQAWERIGDEVREGASRTASPDPALAWQDIRRAIQHEEDQAFARPAVGWRPAWVMAAAAVLILGMLSVSMWRLATGRAPDAASLASGGNETYRRVEWVKAELPGATTMIYTDEETDITVIWMDVAQNGEARDS